MLAGYEAISTVRALATRGETRDWAESVGGQLEDRGYGMDGLVTRDLTTQGTARSPIQLYALFENARRARLHADRDAYALAMGRLFEPFTRVAAGNPHAMSPEARTAEDLATVTAENRLTSDPFPRRMVARDQANQGAAVLMTSVGRARALGVPEDRWVYLHGGADVKERSVMERQDFSRSPAAVLACQRPLDAAGATLADMGLFRPLQLLSNRGVQHLRRPGLSPDDARGLTLTGGLPFFGGAGNNYSMHAIASMVRALRAQPGATGLVGANGGFLSKYSVGIYSTQAKAWRGFDSHGLQAEIDGWAAPVINQDFAVEGSVETYTIDYAGPAPRGVFVGRTPMGERFAAGVDDAELVARMSNT